VATSRLRHVGAWRRIRRIRGPFFFMRSGTIRIEARSRRSAFEIRLYRFAHPHGAKTDILDGDRAGSQRRNFHERCMGPSGTWDVGDDREKRGVVVRARRPIASRIRQRTVAGRTTPFTVSGPQVDVCMANCKMLSKFATEARSGRAKRRPIGSSNARSLPALGSSRPATRDGEGGGGTYYVGTIIGTNERALKTGVGPQIASNQRQN
jgi:hypothetical protein